MPKPFPRKGAWAVVDGAVCVIYQLPQLSVETQGEGEHTVLVELEDPNVAEVHFVDENGETTTRQRDVPIASLTQATLAQIPESRRPDAEIASGMGYLVDV